MSSDLKNKGTYLVTKMSDPMGYPEEEYYTNDPKSAILKWIRFGQEEPTLACIECAQSYDNLRELYFTFLFRGYPYFMDRWCNMKPSFHVVYDICQRKYTELKNFDHTKKDRVDQVDPFSLG